ncbi:MAG: PIN domain-containing protein [Kiritimatiellae bacterium]|nr:PIN domain-containing protein [Kiritimatiellia bacterium]
MTIFLDANILFSASDSKSATRQLLEALATSHRLVTSVHAWEEARRNLERKRPHLLSGLNGLGSRIEITKAFEMPKERPEWLAEKDIPILAGAIGARCTHLWTSDRQHFGRLYGQRVQGLLVLSSIQMAQAYRDSTSSHSIQP